MKLLFTVFIFLYIPYSFGNLIYNHSFEDHKPLKCINCHLSAASFPDIMPHWRRLNSHPFICDYNYLSTVTNDQSGICYFEKEEVKPFDGTTIMEMRYEPNCIDSNHETRGCASYLGTLLKKPLAIGKVYEVSFWLYLKEPSDIDFAKHIGFSLFPDKIRNPSGGMFEQNVFQLDTIIYNQWYQARWTVQPTCDLQFLILGVFRGQDGPKVHSRPNSNIYYIDKVSVVEKKGNMLPIDSLILFCRPQIKTSTYNPEIEAVECYFDVGNKSLSSKTKQILDSFASDAKKYPKTAFLMTGHTDITGSNHTELSLERIQAVLFYLKTKHKISKSRFITVPQGHHEPKSTMQLELNRRVEIRHIDYSVADVVYRNILEQVANSALDIAFENLNIWLYLARDEDKIMLEYDPRIKIISGQKKWIKIREKIKKSYSKYKEYASLAFALDSLWIEDQKHRTLSYHLENLSAYLPEIDSTTSFWNVSFSSPSPDSLLLKANANFSRLKELLGENNWVKSSEVGERAALTNFLIIQHTSAIANFATYLPLLKQRCMQGEAEWLYYATMYDRWKILQDLPQRFGTQSKISEDESQELMPLENKELVNQWRREIGLEALSF